MRASTRTLPFLLAATVALAAPAGAAADPLAIGRWTADGGGTGFGQVGPFILGASIGQPDAGRSARLAYVLTGGFWVPGAAMPLGVDDGPPPPPSDAPPAVARVHALAPNPAVRGTRVAFDLPAPGAVAVRVFDVRGALVRTLAAGAWPAGRHALDWDGALPDGSRAEPGLYLVRVRLDALERTQKLVKLR